MPLPGGVIPPRRPARAGLSDGSSENLTSEVVSSARRCYAVGMDETPDTQDTEMEWPGLPHEPGISPVCDSEEREDCSCREFM